MPPVLINTGGICLMAALHQKNFRAAANAAPTATPATKANPCANNIHAQNNPAFINLRSTVTPPVMRKFVSITTRLRYSTKTTKILAECMVRLLVPY